MGNVEFGSLTEIFNNIALQLAIWIGICAVAYLFIFIIIRMTGVPKPIANIISSLIMLFVLYFTFVNGYFPGISSTHKG